MIAPEPHQRRPIEVIDLVSSDDDHEGTNRAARAPLAPPAVVQMDTDTDTDSSSDADSDSDSVRYVTPDIPNERPERPILEQVVEPVHMQDLRGGRVVLVDGEQIFIPDEDEAPLQAHVGAVNDANVVQDRQVARALDNAREVTVDACLQRVLEIFPDISHDYVYSLYNEFDQGGDYETLPGPARLDNIIEQLVSATSYPKQEKGKKRKREDSTEADPFQQWEREDRVAVPRWLKGSMQAIMKAEFPDIPVQYIADTLVRNIEHLMPYHIISIDHDAFDVMAASCCWLIGFRFLGSRATSISGTHRPRQDSGQRRPH